MTTTFNEPEILIFYNTRTNKITEHSYFNAPIYDETGEFVYIGVL